MVQATAFSLHVLKTGDTMEIHPICTKLCQHKPHDLKDDVSEKQCPVTINPRHMKKAFKVMNELRSQNLLCDVTIVAEDVEIAAHRVVLAAGSPYFHAMFTEMDGWTLGTLIDYVYTAEIQVTEENVQHFSEVVQSEEFLNLGMDQVCSLIASDKLTIPSEEKVFEAVIAWVTHDKDVRQEHMAHLMEHVRLPLLSREYLVQRVEEETLVKNSSACKDYLIEAMKYHLLPADQRSLMKTVRTRMRTPVSLPKVMVVVGGQAPKAIRSVECYDFEEERWYQVAELPSRRCRAGVVYMGGIVYAIGGFNGSLRVRTVDSYDPVKDQWTCVASMQDRRSTLGSSVLNGLLYAVGGFDGSTGLASVEAYNAKTNEWFHIVPMNTRRSSVGVGVVAGYDGATRQCLSTVEAYNPNTNECPGLPCTGVGVLKGLLYAVGGHDGPLVRKSCEVYDPASNTWKQVADMNINLLYVVGGDDGSCNLASVEFYNPSTDKWTLLPSCMSTGRSYAGVTVIDKPL
ncbi:hypothetical protein JZ751_021949 [Albula glossodonta]|uniref:BTB domain-containing protein n=1 Tax=Albula glossodonta TaxID=121402 RepID=A0A8T2MRV2_9TELE|nr:hypothetical protein JZ751_021949 [Albula glossodonta]